MELKNPEYLAGILVFALLLFLLSRIRKRGYHFSGVSAVEKVGVLWRLINFLPTLAYTATAVFLLLALAAPFTTNTREEQVIEGKIIVPCVDVSGSMDLFIAVGGRTKLQAAKDILKEFIDTRTSSDALGLTAFSGGGDGWGAGIIQRPTLSKEDFIAALGKVSSQMFGGSTAIGEGIFVSILAINEMEWHANIQQESGNPDALFNIRRLWASVNTLNLPEFDLPNTDANTQDDFIVSETARLTPPVKNKNKIIILFSDGDSNSGLDPLKSIWLAERLGIKVYYVEVLSAPVPDPDQESSNQKKEDETTAGRPKAVLATQLIQNSPATDYSKIPEHRRLLITAVKRTGGEYFQSDNYDDVRRFFLEISRLEKDLMSPEIRYEISESYLFFVGCACISFLALVVLELIMNI